MKGNWERGQNIVNDLRNNHKSYTDKKKERNERDKDNYDRTKYKPNFVREPEVIVKPKEFNLFEHPEMVSNTQDNNPEIKTISYLDTCKIQQKIDTQVEPLKPGWIGIKNNKYTRDNVNYFSSIDETYSSEEKEELMHQEEEEYIENFKRALDTIYMRREKESNNYYTSTGNSDTYKKEKEKYEQYEKYLEELIEEESDSSSEDECYSDEDSVNSYN